MNAHHDSLDTADALAQACRSMGYSVKDFKNVAIWLSNHRCATRALGGAHELIYDRCEALAIPLQSHFEMQGLRLLLSKETQTVSLTKAPRDEGLDYEAAGYKSDISNEALLAGLFSLYSARDASLKSRKIDPKTGLAVVTPLDVHRLMDAKFARKIQGSPKQVHALWKSFEELGLAFTVPGIDLSPFASALGEAPKLVSPAIEIIITDEAFIAAIELAQQQRPHLSTSPAPDHSEKA